MTHVVPSRAPGVMVSSTFYDLRQHREDLRRFLQDELGYRPLLSEHQSFPINPDVSTIENCRERVARDADVLVLVIGSRYGTIDDRSARSVTNLEYLAARAKGIPIYAFIERGITVLLPMWLQNPQADFSRQVDTPLLFQFVHQVRDVDRVWVQEFDRAHEMMDSLRIQFAYQHTDGLLLARHFRETASRPWLDELHGETLRIALERPERWEHYLFASALKDGVAKYERLRRRHLLRVPATLGEDVHDPGRWLQARFWEARRLVNGVGRLFNERFEDAVGAPGEPGDAQKILFLAETVAGIYHDALRWSERLHNVNIDEAFVPALHPVGHLLDNLIEQIETSGPTIQSATTRALAAMREGSCAEIPLTITVSIPAGLVEQFERELDAALARKQAESRDEDEE